MKKVKSILLVAVLAVAIFVILLSIERHEISKYERIEMAVVKADVPKGTKISKDNLSVYFEIRECDNSLKNSYNVTDLTDLEGQYVTTTLYANTIVNREDFQSVSFSNENINNKVKGSFSVASISDGMNGMLRMGDVVQLYVVNTVGGICEEVLPYNVIIEEAFDTNGILIAAGDNITVATNFNVGIDKQDEAIFYKNISKGNVKVVLADSEAVKLMSESETHKNAIEDSGNEKDDEKEVEKDTTVDVLENQDKSGKK